MQDIQAAAHDTWCKVELAKQPSGKFPLRARLNGEPFLIFQVKDGYRGVQRNCPHMQATLADAELVSNETMIRCRQHVYTFRLHDGHGVNCPGFKIKVFDVMKEEGVFYARAA
jgi:nitrite reductase/ring-hydroxylating ferredoxin subunit